MSRSDTDTPISPVQLEAVVHWVTRPPFAADLDTREARARLLAGCVAAQLRSIEGLLDEEPAEFVICSTVLSGFMAGDPQIAQRFFDLIEEGCGRRPLGIIQTYMCVGWGYALRFFARHTSTRRVLVVLLDVELDNLRYHLRQQAIGVLGFGVSSLLFTLPQDGGEVAQTGGPFADSAFKEFVMAIRSRHAKHGRQYTFGPFLNGEMGGMLDRLLGPRDFLAPNRNDELGHCFGADPFISIIDYLKARPLDAPVDVTAGAIAFNGYYAIATLRLHAGTHHVFHALDADSAALRALIGQYMPETLSPVTADPDVRAAEPSLP